MIPDRGASIGSVGSPSDIEALARIAARLAGHDPDAHVTVRLGNVVAFEDVAWRYPDFIRRAEYAYRLLAAASPDHHFPEDE